MSRVIEVPRMRKRFAWWDDALDVAVFRTRLTGRKHRVRKVGHWASLKPWAVEEVSA